MEKDNHFTLRQIMYRAMAVLALAAILATPAVGQPGPEECNAIFEGAERNPAITERVTVMGPVVNDGEVFELRAGLYKGKLVGWARVLASKFPTPNVVMKVDTNGDRKPDVTCPRGSDIDDVSRFAFTAGPERAFKACVKLPGRPIEGPCSPDFQTDWW